MEVPYKNALSAVFEIDGPYYLLLDQSLNCLLFSPGLLKLLDIDPADADINIQLLNIFPNNDYRVLTNRIQSRQYFNIPIFTSINSRDQNKKFKTTISLLEEKGHNNYLIRMEEIPPPFPIKNIAENFEVFMDLFDYIFNKAPYGIVFFSKENKVLYFNRWFQDFSGYGYLDIITYDDMIRKLSIKQIKNDDGIYIRSWNITNNNGISLNFTALYIELPHEYYAVCLIPARLQSLDYNILIDKEKYLTLFNSAMRSIMDHSNTLKNIAVDISGTKSSTADKAIINGLKLFEQGVLKIIEEINQLLTLQASLLKNTYFNITQKIKSAISILPVNEDKRIILNDVKSDQAGILTYYSGQLDNLISVIINDIYIHIQKGSCTISISSTNIIAISFKLKGRVDTDNLLLNRIDESSYIKSFLDLINAEHRIKARNDRDEVHEFTILIPKSDKNLLLPDEGPFQTSQKLAALVADDEESIRNIAALMLESLGFEVYPAKNGQEAVEIFKKHISKINLVILDVIMPKIDGHQAFKILKALKPEIKVVFTSGYYTESILKAMLEDGKTSYIVKPFTFDDFTRKIQDLCISNNS